MPVSITATPMPAPVLRYQSLEAPVDWSNEVASVDGVALLSVVSLIAALSETARTNGLCASRRAAAAARRADRPLMMCRSTPGCPPSERTSARPWAASTPRLSWMITSTRRRGLSAATRASAPDRPLVAAGPSPVPDATAGTPEGAAPARGATLGLRTTSQATAAENSASATATSPISDRARDPRLDEMQGPAAPRVAATSTNGEISHELSRRRNFGPRSARPRRPAERRVLGADEHDHRIDHLGGPHGESRMRLHPRATPTRSRPPSASPVTPLRPRPRGRCTRASSHRIRARLRGQEPLERDIAYILQPSRRTITLA